MLSAGGDRTLRLVQFAAAAVHHSHWPHHYIAAAAAAPHVSPTPTAGIAFLGALVVLSALGLYLTARRA